MTGNFFVSNYLLPNYKICKYFLQNLLWKSVLYKIFYKIIGSNFLQNFFFITKFIYTFKKIFKIKLTENMSFFSIWCGFQGVCYHKIYFLQLCIPTILLITFFYSLLMKIDSKLHNTREEKTVSTKFYVFFYQILINEIIM